MIENEVISTYLEFVSKDQRSYKFYEIKLIDNTVYINYGRIGHSGRVQTKTFENLDKAKKFYERQLKQKTKFGYKEAIKGERLPRIKNINPKQLLIPFQV